MELGQHDRVTLAKIPRRRLVDEAVAALRQAILDGQFELGERLREEELARRLGISRTPLREAFRMLEEEGLIRVSQGRGVEVTRPTLDEASDLYDIREVLDGLAARRAAAQATPAQLAELDALLAEMEASLQQGDFRRWLGANVRFHEAIAQASGNGRLVRLLPAIRITVEMFHPTLVRSVERPGAALAEHREIVAAIRSGDGDLAETVARRHIRNAKEMLLQALRVEKG